MILRQCKYSVILRNKTFFLIIYPIFSAYQQSYSKKYFANELTLSMLDRYLCLTELNVNCFDCILLPLLPLRIISKRRPANSFQVNRPSAIFFKINTIDTSYAPLPQYQSDGATPMRAVYSHQSVFSWYHPAWSNQKSPCPDTSFPSLSNRPGQQW